MRRRRTPSPESLRDEEQAAQPEQEPLGECRLRRCDACQWLGVPEGPTCPNRCGAGPPKTPAEDVFYHGPWGTYNKQLKPGMTALTPERFETLLEELAIGEKSQHQLSKEYGVPRRTLTRWQNNPARIEASLAAHTKAIVLIRNGKTRADVRRECSVGSAFHAAVRSDAPVAAEAWKTEACRRFGLLHQSPGAPQALPTNGCKYHLGAFACIADCDPQTHPWHQHGADMAAVKSRRLAKTAATAAQGS